MVMSERAAVMTDMERLPPEGASPAGDLQRRVSDAALRNFYASPRVGRFDGWRRPAAIVGISIGSWAAVFGLGAILLHG